MGKFIEIDKTHVKPKRLPHKTKQIETEPTKCKNQGGKTSEKAEVKAKQNPETTTTPNQFDWFLTDEAKSSYESFVNRDYFYHIFDEVCLEGLEGITIEALWKRLSSHQSTALLREDIKEQIWRIICGDITYNVRFFALAEPRKELQLFDRYQCLDVDNNGDLLDMADGIPDIYSYYLVKPPEIVLGSCAGFKTRVDVSEVVRGLSYRQAEKKFGLKLVIVADQQHRTHAIYSEFSDPAGDVNPMDYCFLEKIARSREQGELTQGKYALSRFFNLDTKAVFYYQKHLLQLELIAKQAFNTRCSDVDQNNLGRLIHLRRFYRKTKPRPLIMAEKVINVLKTRAPQYMMEYAEMRRMFPECVVSATRLMKYSEFTKYVWTDILVQYKEIYPNSNPRLWYYRTKRKERWVRVMVLKEPSINIEACWKSGYEDDELDDDEKDDEPSTTQKSINVELNREIYNFILTQGLYGSTLKDVINTFDVDMYSVRTAIRRLQTQNAIDGKRVDIGKQRNFRYFARCLYDSQAEILAEPPKITTRPRKALERLLEKRRRNPQEDNINIPKNHVVLPRYSSNFQQFMLWDFQKNYTIIKRNKIESIPVELEDGCLVYYADFWGMSFKSTTGCFSAPCFIPYENILDGLRCSSFLVIKAGFDPVSKLQLLRVLLDDISITDEHSLELLSPGFRRPLKRKFEETDTPAVLKKKDDALDFMGRNPVKVLEMFDSSNGIKTEIIESTPPEKYVIDEPYFATNKSMTDRVVDRTNLILNTVKERLVIKDVMTSIRDIITEVEKLKGYDKIIDRKSLLRIYARLTQAGYVKFYKVTLSNEALVKNLTLLCHPTVDYNHGLVSRICDHAKIRHFIGKTAEKPVSPFSSSDILKSISEWEQLRITELQLKAQSKYIGRHYGFLPKFARTRLFHEFLAHLVLNVSELDKVCDAEASVICAGIEEPPAVYMPQVDWKMFVSPLPKHKGWGDGWIFVCDLIARVPLSLFVKIFNVTFDVEELKAWLAHPIKRNYLVKDTPAKLRAVLFRRRLYVRQFVDIFFRLSHLGLLQIGPYRQKEKENMFIYFNRHASLLDTTSSAPAYHKTEEKPYPRLKFVFNSVSDVGNYWYNLYNISMNTPLNARNIMLGKTITITDVSGNTELSRVTMPKRAEDVLKYDNGTVPGDGRGAAGLDSGLWVHIQRNWFWGMKPETRDKTLKKITSSKVKFKPNSAPAHRRVATTTEIAAQKFRKTERRKLQITRKMTKYVRPRRKKDALDRSIQSKASKCKVIFDDTEDQLLVLCKAASLFLYPKIPKQRIPYYVLRDVMHRVYTKSRNKTSEAIKRRLHLLHVNDKLSHVYMNVGNLFTMPVLNRYFGSLVQTASTINCPMKIEDKMIAAFVYLMGYCVAHANEVEMLLMGKMMNFDYFSVEDMMGMEFVPLEGGHPRFQQPSTIESIHTSVLKGVIQSTLSLDKDNASWSYQLFRIYQNYSDDLMRDAIEEMKQQQIMSQKRPMRKNKGTNKFHIPYQLSNLYIYSTAGTFNDITVDGAGRTLDLMPQQRVDLEWEDERYGRLLVVNEMALVSELRVELDVPDVVVTLNSKVLNHDEVVDELAVKFQAKQRKQAEIDGVEYLVSLEEIKRGMLEESSTTPRTVPHITELYELLDESSEEDERLDNLRKHFTPIFPYVRQIYLETPPNLPETSTDRHRTIWRKIRKSWIIDNRWNNLDHNLEFQRALDVLAFVQTKEYLGATAEEIRRNFDCTVDALVRLLVERGLVLKAGVCVLVFVHYQYQSAWLVETCPLSREEVELLDKSEAKELAEVKSNVERNLSCKQTVFFHVRPWTKVDGTLNEALFRFWISLVLSHCLELPKVPLVCLFDRYPYIKPVDLYNLVEILQDLGCLKVTCHESNYSDLWTFRTTVEDRPATCLDDFNHIFLEPTTHAMSSIASFLQDSQE